MHGRLSVNGKAHALSAASSFERVHAAYARWQKRGLDEMNDCHRAKGGKHTWAGIYYFQQHSPRRRFYACFSDYMSGGRMGGPLPRSLTVCATQSMPFLAQERQCSFGGIFVIIPREEARNVLQCNDGRGVVRQQMCMGRAYRYLHDIYQVTS